ncbi:MAG: hypothetical protein K2K78_04375 [Muribaculaceae bacterium]|nr:hypothetical protein [Muribaculaceae bacterium]
MSNKKGVRRRLEDFIASDRGQRFFNFAYSIGAAVVIWEHYSRYCICREATHC